MFIDHGVLADIQLFVTALLRACTRLTKTGKKKEEEEEEGGRGITLSYSTLIGSIKRTKSEGECLSYGCIPHFAWR